MTDMRPALTGIRSFIGHAHSYSSCWFNALNQKGQPALTSIERKKLLGHGAYRQGSNLKKQRSDSPLLLKWIPLCCPILSCHDKEVSYDWFTATMASLAKS